MDLYALLPSDLTVVSAGGLVALSFFTSALTAQNNKSRQIIKQNKIK